MASSDPILGIDIGGTKIAAGLVSGRRVTHVVELPTEAGKGKKTVLKNIEAAIRAVNPGRAKAIGIGIAGLIDSHRGIIVQSPNFSQDFKNVGLKKHIRQKFGKSAAVNNDANCFTLAEAVYGSGKNKDVVIGLTLGTGIGGGIVLKQQLLVGRDGGAGELGHTTIFQNGVKCSCGRRGHVEAYASGTAIAKTYAQLTGTLTDTWEIERLARLGDQDAKAAFQIAQTALAETFFNITQVFNPDIIVLGGGLASVKKLLVTPAIAKAKQLFYPAARPPQIVAGTLDRAGIIGAARLTNQ